MMARLLMTEIRKLSGSLILLLVCIPPLLPGLLIALAMVTNETAPAWSQLVAQLALPLWAMFLNPSLLATVATLMGQVEYRTNGWAFMLTQPLPRWQVFATKLLVLTGLHFTMIALCVIGAIGSGLALGFITGKMPTGELPWREGARFVWLIGAGSFAILAIQLWVALRWNNFVVPLAMGIGGTLIGLAVLITGTDRADWFPWIIALRAALFEGGESFALAGAGLGAAVTVVMLADLNRHAFR